MSGEERRSDLGGVGGFDGYAQRRSFKIFRYQTFPHQLGPQGGVGRDQELDPDGTSRWQSMARLLDAPDTRDGKALVVVLGSRIVKHR